MAINGPGSTICVGDRAFGGANAIITRKGNTAFNIFYTDLGGGNHEQAL
jgi:hypothetical protein